MASAWHRLHPVASDDFGEGPVIEGPEGAEELADGVLVPVPRVAVARDPLVTLHLVAPSLDKGRREKGRTGRRRVAVAADIAIQVAPAA